jgi:transposase
MRIAPSLQVTVTERQQLAQWARGRRTPARLVLRAHIILLAAEGHDNQHIAAALDTSRQTVGLWRHRFATQRLPGIAQDAPRGGRPPKARQALISRILNTTTHTTPPAATHWSPRTLARHLRTNPTFVQRVWTAHGLQPPTESGPLSSAGIRTSRTNWRTWWACI